MTRPIALAVLAALTALTIGGAAGQQPAAPDQIVVWQGQDGGDRRATVAADAWARFAEERQSTLERARRASARRIETAMTETLRPVLADGEARTEAFVDWVFDWWTAYLLLAQTTGRAAGTMTVRPDAVLRAAEQTLEARVADAYRDLVLRPAVTDRRLRSAALAIDRAAAEELRAECREAIAASRRFLSAHGRRIEARTGPGTWREASEAVPGGQDVAGACARIAPDPDAIVLAAAPPTAAAALGPGPSGSFLAVRLARPFVTFAAGTALRLAIPAIGTAVVVGGVAVSSLAMGTALDYVLNETDEAIHRKDVEGEVNAMVRAAAGAYEADAAARHRRTAEQALRRLAAVLPSAP